MVFKYQGCSIPMVNTTYKIINNQEEWNDRIIQYDNFSPYQCYEWGEYKKATGWQTLAIMGNKDGEVGYLQITCKKKWNILFVWCIGSISGKTLAFNQEDFCCFLQHQFQVKKILIRSSFTIPHSHQESFELFSLGWKKNQIKKLNTDYTIYLNLQHSCEYILSQCSSNFRKNIKRGLENNAIVIKKLSQCDISEIFQLYLRFHQIKQKVSIQENDLFYIHKILGENIIVAIARDNNKPIALRAFLFLDKKALDFWAFSDENGRKKYSSYALVFKLLQKAQEMGISSYDLSGIDPIDNPQVFSFKNGLRGEITEKLGEWEICNSPYLSWAFNHFIIR